MIALLLTFPDTRRTRLLRVYLSLEDMVAHLPANRPGLRAEAVEVPDQMCSNLEHPCTATRLLRYMDSLPREAKMEIYP